MPKPPSKALGSDEVVVGEPGLEVSEASAAVVVDAVSVLAGSFRRSNSG